MNNKQFNLTTDPWIKVIDSDSKTCEVSLIDFSKMPITIGNWQEKCDLKTLR